MFANNEIILSWPKVRNFCKKILLLLKWKTKTALMFLLHLYVTGTHVDLGFCIRWYAKINQCYSSFRIVPLLICKYYNFVLFQNFALPCLSSSYATGKFGCWHSLRWIWNIYQYSEGWNIVNFILCFNLVRCTCPEIR